MSTVEHVVRRFGPAWEPAQPPELAERRELIDPTGQQLVRVGLMTGVPDDAIAWRLQQPVERDGQLDDTERRSEVTARRRDGADDRLADLDGELGKLDLV